MSTVPDAAWYAVMVVGIGASVGVVYLLSRPRGRWGRLARKRLVLGVPWGTLIAVGTVIAVYLFLQDGLTDPHDPVVIPFRAWSYAYPLGLLASGFAHSSLGHITGNLLSALVFGSLAEYAWSHYPEKRGSQAFSSLGSNPFARIVGFAVGVFAVSIFSGMFALGPVIGFSGTVFAFVGFALVRFPLATIVATLFTSVVRLLYNTVRNPEIAVVVGETTVGRPWWAGTALQGHAIGLFAGVVLGVALLYRRDVRPSPEHIWLAALIFAVDRGMWAVYLIEGSGEYRLFRALGVALVFVLAAVVAGSAVASARTLIHRIDLSRREAAFGVAVSILLALSLVAVPFNLFVVDDPTAGLEDAQPTDVGDYTVFYATDVPNQFVPAVPMPGGNTTDERVRASGVIVVSEQRNIWWEEVSTTELRVNRQETIRLGGVGWSETVHASRTTWTVAGGNTTYNVQLGTDEEISVVHRAEPARVDAMIDGRNVTIAPVDDRFEIRVTRDNETLGVTPIPEEDVRLAAGGIVFERDGSVVVATRDETKIRIASRSG